MHILKFYTFFFGRGLIHHRTIPVDPIYLLTNHLQIVTKRAVLAIAINGCC